MRLKIQASFAIKPYLTLTLSLITTSLGLFGLWQRDPNIAEEDRLIEWLQAACLGGAACIHAHRSRAESHEMISRLIRRGLALLAASFLLRELDIDSWGNPSVADPIQFTLRLTLVILWLIYARPLFQHIPVLWKNFTKTLGAPTVFLASIGCCFYAASWPFEKELFALSENSSKFIGQLLQLHACALLLSSSLIQRSCRFTSRDDHGPCRRC